MHQPQRHLRIIKIYASILKTFALKFLLSLDLLIILEYVQHQNHKNIFSHHF